MLTTKTQKRCRKHTLTYVRTERAANRRTNEFRILTVFKCTECGKTIRHNEKGNRVPNR